MSFAAGRVPGPRGVLLIAVLAHGWNGSTRIAVVLVLGDGTELLRRATDFELFYQDDGALIGGSYPCSQDSSLEYERLKINRKRASGPGQLAPALLCIGDRDYQSASYQKRNKTHKTSEAVARTLDLEQLQR